jgi:hypothetical protein
VTAAKQVRARHASLPSQRRCDDTHDNTARQGS